MEAVVAVEDLAATVEAAAVAGEGAEVEVADLAGAEAEAGVAAGADLAAAGEAEAEAEGLVEAKEVTAVRIVQPAATEPTDHQKAPLQPDNPAAKPEEAEENSSNSGSNTLLHSNFPKIQEPQKPKQPKTTKNILSQNFWNSIKTQKAKKTEIPIFTSGAKRRMFGLAPSKLFLFHRLIKPKQDIKLTKKIKNPNHPARQSELS